MKLCKRIVAMLILVGMLASLLVVPTAAKGAKNMFTNGNFSFGTNGWNLWSSDPAAASSTIVSDGGPDGSKCLKITNTKAVPTSLSQNVLCKKGQKYILTCDIKYENVSSDNGGLGVCIGYSLYNSNGDNIKEGLSTSYFGSSDWRTISYVFELDTDPGRFSIGPRLWVSSGTLYVDNITLQAISDEPAVSATYDLTLSETPNRHTVDSLGCEWDPKMLLAVNAEHGVTADDLDIIKARMDDLGLQAVRMMITPDWFEPVNDNDDPTVADPAGFDFDNDEMRSVFAYLKVAEELGIRVTLTWWGAPTGCWLAYDDTGDWIGAPNDLAEMTENITYLLSYIREILGYNCVKELILQNEPSYSFKVSGGAVDFDYYVAYYRTVYDALVAKGMDDIVLVGADDSQHYGWYTQSYEALKDICGKFNSHNYAWSYDYPYLDVMAQEFVQARTAISGDIPFYLGEFGDGSTVGAYVAESTDTFGRGIYVASIVVNAFKAGAAGASYWPLHDIYYYDGDPNGGDNGGLMSQGLISFKKDGAWGYRPTYYAYGLLCNYIPYGSAVYNVTGNTDHLVDTVAVKTPEGRWSIVAVNRSDAAQTLNIDAAVIDSNLNRYAYVDGTLPTDGSMIAADGRVAPANGVYSVTVPATGFVVLSNIGMTEEEMGVVTVPETQPETQPETWPETIPATELETTPDTDPETDPVIESDPAPETNTDTPPETAPVTAPETAADTADTAETTVIGGVDTAAATEKTEVTSPDTDTGADGGCRSSMGLGAFLLALPAALALKKKKRREE